MFFRHADYIKLLNYQCHLLLGHGHVVLNPKTVADTHICAEDFRLFNAWCPRHTGCPSRIYTDISRNNGKNQILLLYYEHLWAKAFLSIIV